MKNIIYAIFILAILFYSNLFGQSDCIVVSNENDTLKLYNVLLKNFKENNFYKIDEIETQFIKIIKGKLFSENENHLFVKYFDSIDSKYLFGVFSFANKYISNDPLVFASLDYSSFISDTLMDVNGDDQIDLVLHFYPSSGCCLRNIHWIYLYENLNKKFSDKLELINPTYLENEKTVLGIGYGQSGEVPLYKKKFNGNNLVLLQEIFPIKKSKNKFLLKDYKNGIVISDKHISELPKEFQKLDKISLKWFFNN